ncbi:hypothetical protein PG630_03245 [Riemerella anatipestifer]|nr:hypothetical protein [Riemerella anatipestifer]
MKKILLCAVFLPLVLNAQDYSGRVGINTNSPNATLEISKEGNSESKGLIIPRLTATEVKTMTGNGNVGENQNSMMVYITEGFATPDTDKVGKYEFIDTTGYYYYDHNTSTPENSRWRKIGNGVYTAGKGMKLTGTQFSRDGLEKVTENGKTGWRMIGRASSGFGGIGSSAVDFSYSNDVNVTDNGALGTASFAVGEDVKASGDLSVVFGKKNKSEGDFSVAFGKDSYAKGALSFAFGNKAQAESGAFAFGREVVAQNLFSTVLGFGNTLVSGGDNFYNPTAKRRLFVIGNGSTTVDGTGVITGVAQRSDAFTILSNGQMGLDIDNFENNNSNAKLQVNGKTIFGEFTDASSIGAARAQLDVRGDLALGTLDEYNNASYVLVEGINGVVKKKSISGITGVSNNLYTSDGILSGKRTVGQGTNDLVFTGTGKVGIGATAPTEKLEVAGKVKANTFIATQTGSVFPDYVFQKYYTGTSSIKADYSFKTLSQVEDFVKQNGHLPGYLSAAKVKEQGYVDLMATQLTNVEKIEELYLHSIEQDKTLKSQKEELKAKDIKIAELEARLQKLEALLVK